MSGEFVRVFSSIDQTELNPEPSTCVVLYDCPNDVTLKAYVIWMFEVIQCATDDALRQT